MQGSTGENGARGRKSGDARSFLGRMAHTVFGRTEASDLRQTRVEPTSTVEPGWRDDAVRSDGSAIAVLTPCIIKAAALASAIWMTSGCALTIVSSAHPSRMWGSAVAAAGVCNLLIAFQTNVMLRRLERPIAALAASVATTVAVTLLLNDRSFAQTPLLVISVVSFAIHLRGFRAYACLLAAAVGDSLAQLTVLARYPERGGDLPLMSASVLLNVTLSFSLYFSVGRVVATYQRRLLELQQKFLRQNREHERVLQESMAAERRRMARELHDVAAHHLVAIVIEGKAAQQINAPDPAELTAIVAEITDQASRSLHSLRQIVELLRMDGEFGDIPQPTIDDLEELIQDFTNTLPEIALRRRGSFTDLDDAVHLSCYRIVQECLANVARHSPGADVVVVVVRSGAGVKIDVTNGPPRRPALGAGLGFGMLGMTERAELLGGHLESGPTPDGGWRVSGYLDGSGPI